MEDHDLLAAIHAAFACVAVLFLIPAAILTARFKRSVEPTPLPGHHSRWVRTHMLLNVAAFLLLTVAFGLGIGAVLVEGDGYQFGGDDTDLHHQLGLALFLLVFVQVVLGLGMLFIKQKQPYRGVDNIHGTAKATGTGTATAGIAEKHWTRWIHMLLGGATLAMLWWQSWDGLHTEWPTMSEEGTTVPVAIQVLFWVILLLPLGPYVIHLLSATCRVLRAAPTTPYDVDTPFDQASARKSQQEPGGRGSTPGSILAASAEAIARPERVRAASNPNPFEGSSTRTSTGDGGGKDPKVTVRMPSSLLASKTRPKSAGESIAMTEAQTIAADAGRRPALKFKERPV